MPKQNQKTILHPLLCGFAWSMLVFIISMIFLGVKYWWAVLVGAEPLQRMKNLATNGSRVELKKDESLTP